MFRVQISSGEIVTVVASMVTKVNIVQVSRSESFHKGRVVGSVIRKGTACSLTGKLKQQKAKTKRLILPVLLKRVTMRVWMNSLFRYETRRKCHVI